jgi:pimeloyl-ACP methyl ester carboxylesterase
VLYIRGQSCTCWFRAPFHSLSEDAPHSRALQASQRLAVRAADGVSIAVERLCSPSPPNASAQLLFAHATGFCRQVWHPCIDDLLAALHRRPKHGSILERGVDVWLWDFRLHGDTGAAPLPPRWSHFGDDASAVTLHAIKTSKEEASVPHTRIGIGHSMG